MKTFVKKIIVTLILMMMFLNNAFLLIIANALDETEPIVNENNINVLQNIVLEKYVNYNTGNISGVLAQFNLKTGIEYIDGEEYVPLGSTGILLNVPKIDDKFPENVEVVGKTTKATNGSDIAKDFRHVYNKDTGELKLAVVNEQDENGKIYSENIDGARDEYTIICYYNEDCYNDSNVERNLELSGFVQVNIENEIGTRKRAEVNENWTVKENISGLISSNIETTEIYNGYIQSNNRNKTKYETEYIENLEIDVSVGQLCDEIHLVTDNNFVNKDNELNDKDKIIYKSTKIEKNKVMDLLGENGYLQILNSNGDILGELNKDTEVGENGVYEIIYQDDVNDILIKTSKIENIGTILLQNTKHIKSNMTNLENIKIYSKNSINCFNNIEKVSEEIKEDENVIQNEVLEGQEQTDSEEIEQKEIYNSYNENVTDIKAAESRIDLSIDKSEWTNNVQNDVVITASLVSDDSRYKLFDNPVIEIKLPDEVEKVTLGHVSVLYENSLSIFSTEYIEESKIIRVTLNGKQKEYNLDSIVSGPEILIPVSLIINKETPSIDTSIVYGYSNDGEVIENKQLNVNIKSAFVFLMTKPVETPNVQSNVVVNDKLKTEILAKVGDEVIQENDVVYENESIVFNVKLINDTNTVINNPKVVYSIPEGLVLVNRNTYFSDIPVEDGEGHEKNPLYTELAEQSEIVVEIESLEPGEIYEKTFRVLVNKLPKDEKEKIIENEFKTIIDGKEINNTKIDYIAQNAELSINLYPYKKELITKETNPFSYFLDVENLTNNDLKDVKVRIVLGKELELDYVVGKHDKIEYDENTSILELTFNQLLSNSIETIKIYTYANKFEDNKNEYNVKLYSYIYCEEDKKYRSDVEEIKVETSYVTIVQTSEKEGFDLNADEEIEYNFIVENPSNLETIIDISDNLPKGLLPMIAEYECYEIKEDNSGYEKVIKTKDISAKHTIDGVVLSDFELRTYIPAKGTIKIKIKAKVDAVFNNIEVANFATVTGDEIFARTSNAIKNTIITFVKEDTEDTEGTDDPEIPSEPNQPDSPAEPVNPEDGDKNYSINGVVWVDENKDGKRIQSEKLLQGITVKLFDVESNRIVVDENNVSKICETDENGFYKFDNIKKGKYIVLFEFDTGLYSLTAYQKNSISADFNSDVILKKVNIDGKIYDVGVTDIIDLYQNHYNVDMGLVENTKFDLKLDKYVSKITVNYNNKEKVYEYDNLKLAKVEIPKKEISETVVNIEYKIIVTNEGNISGYVESIVDYLPKEMTFVASNNKGWKKDSNNNLINDSLASKKLNPGESQEVTLLLSVKNVTKNLINEAEIGIANNVNQIEDIDSKANNRNQNEDDYSKAEVIVAVKTGIIKNIFIIFIIIGILIIISYIIYSIKNKKIRIFNILPIMIIGMFLTPIMSSITFANDDPRETYGPDFAVVAYPDLKYHFKHGSGWTVVNESGEFYCASPSEHLCRLPHKFLKQNVRWEYYEEEKDTIWEQLGGCTDYSLWDFSITGNPPQEFTLTKNSSPNLDNAYYYSSKEIVLGPFNFSTSLNESYIDSWSVVNQDGHDITGSSRICNSRGESKGLNFSDTFYIAVPEGVSSIKLTITAKYKYEQIKKGVGITTYRIDTSDSSYCTNSETQDLRTVDEIEKVLEGEVEASISWNVTIPKGTLRINKKDTDTNGGLSGARFKITGLDDPKNIKFSKVVTMEDGPTIPIRLLPGNYKVEEIGTPDGYVLKLQVKEDIVQEGEVIVDNTTEFTFTNRMYGNLVLQKVDFNKLDDGLAKGELDELEDLIFKETKFRIFYVLPGKEYKNPANRKYISNFVKKTEEPSTFTQPAPSDPNQADIFEITSDNDKIELPNIPTHYNYYVEELEITEDMKQYYDTDTEPRPIKLHTKMKKYNNNTNTLSNEDFSKQFHNRNMRSNAYGNMWFGFTNKQLRVDIQGYVWEDIGTGKNTVRDNLYTPKNVYEEGDKRIPKIPVYLKKDGQIIAVRYTYTGAEQEDYEKNIGKEGYPEYPKIEEGNYFFPAKGLKYDDRQYHPVDNPYYTIDISDINQNKYLVEFKYNGLQYQCVVPPIDKPNGSKAVEKADDRISINDNFHTILKDYKAGLDQGKTGTGIGLTYSRPEDYKSKLLDDGDAYYKESLDGKMSDPEAAMITADTNTAGYELKWSTNTRVIKNVNLGIYEREQPDYAIVTDIEDIELKINGYSHIYEYKTRSSEYVKPGYPDKDIDPNYNELLDGFSVAVKQGQNKYKGLSYTREIYDSYIAYNKSGHATEENRLKVFVRYKIVVKNESSSLLSKVSLKNYADSRLINPESVYIDSTNVEKELIWTDIKNENGSIIRTTSVIDNYIKPTECMTIYIKYELNNDTIIELAKEKNIELERNITEIMAYSTFSTEQDENGNQTVVAYGGIDKDSAPDNTNFDEIKTYEDDIDVAPGLAFKRKTSKLISGLVFEDSTSSELLTNNERIGRKRYENGEKGVSGVDVKMMKRNEDGQSSIIKLYNLDDEGVAIVTNAQDLTEDGEYEFTGMVPGEYYLQYTYGYYNRKDSNNSDTVSRVQTKIGDITVTTESYKSTIIETNAYDGGLKTLIDNNIENPNGYSVIKADYDTKYNNGESQNALWYWYQKGDPDWHYSSAADYMIMRKEINDSLQVVDYNIKANYDEINPEEHEPQDRQSIQSNTGYMDFPIEDIRDQTLNWNDLNAQNSRTYEIKFGIVERPRQSVQVNKEISNIKITLANGQVLLEGDPRIDPSISKYVTYPPGGMLKIEIDNEIIEGAILDITYEISVENKSEIDYRDYDEDDIIEAGEFKYYRYGDKTGLETVKLTLNSIVDYADEKLSFTYDIDEGNILYYDTNPQVKDKWLLVENASAEENQLAGVNIHNEVYDAVKHRKNLLVMNLEKDFGLGENVSMKLNARKLLTDLVDIDQVFNNHVEILKMGNVVGRFYGELQDNGIWKVNTPGNFNPTNENSIINTTEWDNNSHIRARLTIIPPTGIETILIYSALGVICLIILAGGIIFIKKKVLG